MKTPLIYSLLLFLPLFAFGQNKKARIDTVYSNTNKTTTLMFPGDVIMVDIGSEDFGWIKSGNLVLVKSAVESAAPTTILVQYGADKEVYHGTVAYKAVIPQTMINFKDAEIPKMPNESRIKADSLKTLEEDLANKRLNILVADTKSKYKTLAQRNEKLKLTIALSNMMTDEHNVYMKLLFINSSKLDYVIDFAEFVYSDPIEKGELKGSSDKKNVYPVVTNKIEGIRAKEERFLGYCIPRYALSRKGELLVTIREKKGSRVMELSIPFLTIMEATPVNKEKI